MSTPRKHHYLPQFYLKGFSSDSRSLTQIDKESGRTATCSLKDIATIKDYHRLDSDDVDDPQQLERRLSKIEADHSATLHEVLSGGIQNPENHSGLMGLVSLMRMRVPAMKTMIKMFQHQVVQTTGQIMERNGLLPKQPAGLESACSMSNVEINISNWICLKYMFELACDKDILNTFLSMQPSILIAPPGTAFITCDQPVAIYSPSAYPSEHQGVALAENDVEISLPLSSNTLLLLKWKQGIPENKKLLKANDVEEFNRRTVMMASSYVFTTNLYREKAIGLVGQYGKYSAGIQPPKKYERGESIYHTIHCRPVLSLDKYN
jgi:hypothetical protein